MRPADHLPAVGRHEEHARFHGVVTHDRVLVEQAFGDALGDDVRFRRSDVTYRVYEPLEVLLARWSDRVIRPIADVLLDGSGVELDPERPTVVLQISFGHQPL